MVEYRIHTSSDLDGHAMGNLILTAMLDITGSLKESIASLSKLFGRKTYSITNLRRFIFNINGTR